MFLNKLFRQKEIFSGLNCNNQAVIEKEWQENSENNFFCAGAVWYDKYIKL